MGNSHRTGTKLAIVTFPQEQQVDGCGHRETFVHRDVGPLSEGDRHLKALRVHREGPAG